MSHAQGILQHEDGSTTLKIAASADEIHLEIRLIAVHLVSADVLYEEPKKGQKGSTGPSAQSEVISDSTPTDMHSVLMCTGSLL